MAGGGIRATLEIRDMFPEKFQAVLEDGAAIDLRLQIELWEDRPVWDKLAQPAVVSVFRIVMDPATRIASRSPINHMEKSASSRRGRSR